MAAVAWPTSYDRNRAGTRHADTMGRIMAALTDLKLTYHTELAHYRNGATEDRRVEDIEPIYDVIETPTRRKYGLRVSARVLNRVLMAHEQIANELNVDNVTIAREGRIVYVSIPLAPDQVQTVDYAALMAKHRLGQGVVLLGLDDNCAPLALDMNRPENAHGAAFGMTGSGKTTLMLTMAGSALESGVTVALFDPMGKLEPISGHPGVWGGGIFKGYDIIAAGLADLAGQVAMQREDFTLVVVDEVPLLLANRPDCKSHLVTLAQSGRQSGLHLLLGSQQALSSELGSGTLRNISIRILGRVADPTAAFGAAGRSGTGAERLRGSGDMVYCNGDVLVHFQAAMMSDGTLAAWPTPKLVYLPGPMPAAEESGVIAGRNIQAGSAGNFTRPTSDGEPGRPLDSIASEVTLAIRQEHRRLVRKGKTGSEAWPSLSWVERLTRKLYGQGFNRDKARRARDMANMPQELNYGTEIE